MTVEKVYSNKYKFAIILRDGHEPSGTMFYTDKEDSLQLGTIKHETGYVGLPHIHHKKKKIIMDVVESMYVVYGKVAVDFFQDKKLFSTITLNAGDTILLNEGVHRIRVLETFKGILAKQGPYVSIEDDKCFVETDNENSSV